MPSGRCTRCPRPGPGKEPFFAYLATNAPHLPFVAPAKNIKRFTDLGFSGNEAGGGMAGFYGMKADPGQTTDVAAAHPEVVQAMRVAWDRHWKEARPLMVNADAPLSTVQPYGVWYREQLKTRGIPDWREPRLSSGNIPLSAK